MSDTVLINAYFYAFEMPKAQLARYNVNVQATSEERRIVMLEPERRTLRMRSKRLEVAGGAPSARLMRWRMTTERPAGGEFVNADLADALLRQIYFTQAELYKLNVVASFLSESVSWTQYMYDLVSGVQILRLDQYVESHGVYFVPEKVVVDDVSVDDVEGVRMARRISSRRLDRLMQNDVW